jgi:expansin (peptidoglycan-binding protein)
MFKTPLLVIGIASLLLGACGPDKGTFRGQGGSGGQGTSSDSTSATSGTAGGTTSSSTTTSGATTSTGSTTSSGSTSSSSTTSTGSGGAVCMLPPGYNDGSVTWYTFSMGSSAVNCGFDILSTSPDSVAYVPYGSGRYFGAMNTADYDTAAVCGACVEVTRDGTKKVDIMIVDQCPTPSNPKCIPGHIDLSQEAFAQIGNLNEGYLGTTNGGAAGHISWRYIPCDAPGDVAFRLKEPTNQYWNQILVEGHRTPIVLLEAEINGTWQEGVRTDYNYWQVGNGNLGPAPYHLRITDVNGAQIEASLSLTAGDQHSGKQFPACQ